ncbi:hypothetical protein L2E82_13873 [Cichorium intybus]|uniref:Uncharacterized protein n=1 Tax=Cichorium intybus TaxID=13427 RepID=A0ACB9EYH1_CICIN|nr:hypothetical protein L2E82_13873 [Cichorium intybus]
MDLTCIHHHRENMESLEAEDTVFYAELTRQILLLMDEDDEIHGGRNRKGESPEFQRRSVVASGNYFSWCEGGRNLEVPCWMERLWASNGTGTGVFIPRVVATGKTRRRRHNKARRNDGGRMHSCAGDKIHC